MALQLILSFESDERAGKKASSLKKNKMKQTCQTADNWIGEEEIPVSPALKVIRANDPWQGLGEEKIEDAKEFIR
jgi:hypothetical protein